MIRYEGTFNLSSKTNKEPAESNTSCKQIQPVSIWKKNVKWQSVDSVVR